MSDKYQVFLSFPMAESAWSSSFATSLKERGFSVFSGPGDLGPGEKVTETIESALKESEVVVLVVDSSSLQSPWLAFEWGAAKGLGKPVIPVLAPGAELEGVASVFRKDEGLIRGKEPKETAEQVVSLLKASTGK